MSVGTVGSLSDDGLREVRPAVPRILGLDLSLTATGWATTIFDGARLCGVMTSRHRGAERLADIRHQIRMALFTHHVDVVVLEGYSYGSKNSHAHALGELGGVVRVMLWYEKVPYVDVAPKLVKKFATDNGNASKEMMLGAAIRQHGYGGNNHNEADALWLAEMGSAHYGMGAGPGLAAYRQACLAKVEWPDLKVAP